jgi:hypothetical protein
MEQQALIPAALVVVIIILIVVYRRGSGPANGGATETSRRFTGPRLTTDIVVPLARDQYRSAYWMPTYVGGKSVNAIADTGSPYFIVPLSLPCPKTTVCTLTGARTKITYGDGTTDNAVFTASHTDLGENHFPSLVFGGSEEAGTGSASASDAIIGLAPLKAPSGFKTPVGVSIVEQIGATLLEFDFTSEWDASLRLAPASHYAKTSGTLVAEGALVPRGRLWTIGVDHASDFYVVELPAQAPSLGQLKYLIIDTGTTMTLLPQTPQNAVTIKFPKGEIAVPRDELGKLPPMYQGKAGETLNPEIGILGNRTMTGYRVLLDMAKGVCRFYR